MWFENTNNAKEEEEGEVGRCANYNNLILTRCQLIPDVGWVGMADPRLCVDFCQSCQCKDYPALITMQTPFQFHKHTKTDYLHIPHNLEIKSGR